MAATLKHGLKRKRDGQRKPTDTTSRLRAKLHHGLKEVTKASKKVKAFETRKVVKKLKDARKGGDEINIKSLEVQLDCLKHVDCENVAVKSLRSKLKKTAPLCKNDNVQEAASTELILSSKEPSQSDPVRALVESRILSSKILAAEVKEVVQALEMVLGIGKEDRPTSDGQAHIDSEEEEESDEVAPDQDQSSEESEGVDVATVSNDHVAWTGFNNTSHSGTEGSDEDEPSESRDSDDAFSVSEDSRPADTSPPHSPRMKKSRSSATVPTEKKAKAGESTFLPSLAVGFISGSSDSEWDDAEANVADVPIKKNRRGQRARKAIWEKKYGKNANHLRKQREAEVNTAVRTAYAHRDGRERGSQNSNVVRGRGRGRGISSGSSESRQIRDNNDSTRGARAPHTKQLANVRPHERRHEGVVSDNTPLHPSWEAKRRLKEKQSAAILPAMGIKLKST